MGRVLRSMLTLGVVLSLAASFTANAPAAIIQFSGNDSGAGPNQPRPNSNTAAASFDAAAGALGALNLITFESTQIGSFSSRVVAPGVTVTLLNNSGGGVFTSSDVITGYNTTSGGARFLQVSPTFNQSITSAGAEFTFADPIQAFGTYLTGLGTSTGALSAVFNDGTTQSIAIVGNQGGGVQFFGFTDAGKSISQIALQLQSPTGFLGDVFGIDDVRYVGATAVVPEPLPLVQCGAALLAGLGYRVTRRLRRRG